MKEKSKKSEQGQDNYLFIFFEDASESMVYKQRLVQLENEVYLRIEVEKHNKYS